LFIQQKLKPKLDKPLNLKDFASKLDKNSPYVGVFIPGGHGAMIGLPDDENVAKVLDWAVDNDKYIVTLCHGPAALLATKNKKFDGYSLVCFPNSLDKFSSLIGYLPGPLPWYMGDKLVEQGGMKILNAMVTGATHVDRKLITGDSPSAANALGKLAAETILAELNPKSAQDDDI
jgi:molecular chaperone Hsp31 and glyoxalase 3